MLGTKQAQPGMQLRDMAPPHRREESPSEQDIVLQQPGGGRVGVWGLVRRDGVEEGRKS